MSEVAAHDLKFPQWFTRLCVLASLVWFLALAYQIALGIWWTASSTAQIEMLSDKVDNLQADYEQLKIRYSNLKTDYAVLLDRTEREKK